MLETVPDEIGRVGGRSRHRPRGPAGPGDDHADLYRLPGHPGDRATSARRSTAPATPMSRSRRCWRLDDRLDQRRGQGEAARLRHRAADPDGRARGALPAMRLGRHRGDQPVRIDAVQGAVALPPAPSRSTCSSATDPAMSVSFHSLRVAEVVPETAEAKSIRFAVPAELRETFRFKPGQPHPPGRDRRRGSAPQLFALRRAAGRPGDGRSSASPAASSPTGPTTISGPATRST